MLKMIKLSIAAVAVLFFAGCTDMVPVQQTEVAFEVNNDGTWGNRMYSGENIYIDSWCRKKCDDAHVWESHHMVVPVESEYAMPKSNDMDLTLGLNIKVTLDKSGTKEEFRQRLMNSAKKYKYSVYGNISDPQTFKTSLIDIINVDLNKAQVKGKVRPILEPYTLSDAYYNIAKGGSIVDDVMIAIKQHLEEIGSPLMVLGVEVEKVSQPQELLDKKKLEESLDSSEKIQLRQLAMTERRMAREQLIALKAANNEIELLEINAPFMTPEVLAYKWIMVAEKFADRGLPFATTPEMLLPSIEKLTDMSIDSSKAKARLQERIEAVENEIKKEVDCTENNCDTQM